MSERVHVLIRVRPENQKERDKGGQPCITFPPGAETECEVDCSSKGFGIKRFTFDKIFHPDSTQIEVFEHMGRPVVDDVIKGYNGTILAYGQTSSGKTHTMMGPAGGTVDVVTPGTPQYSDRGLIPRIGMSLFEALNKLPEAEIQWSVTMSCFELYKENIRDLLNPNATGIEYRIREDNISGKGVYVENLAQKDVRNVEVSVLRVLREVLRPLLSQGVPLWFEAPHAIPPWVCTCCTRSPPNPSQASTANTRQHSALVCTVIV